MTLKAETHITRLRHMARVLLATVGALLLFDALVLMAMGHFNVGVVLPAIFGSAALWLGWKWQAVQRWRDARPLHARIWTLGWTGFGVWLLSLLWFWSRLFSLGLQPQLVPPVQAIVVLGSGTLNGQPRPVLAAAWTRRQSWPDCNLQP